MTSNISDQLLLVNFPAGMYFSFLTLNLFNTGRAKETYTGIGKPVALKPLFRFLLVGNETAASLFLAVYQNGVPIACVQTQLVCEIELS